MNDFNEFNSNNVQRFSTETNGVSSPKSPKKKHGAARVAAMLAAVVIVGGGAGFGGAYLAGSSDTALVADSSGSAVVSDSVYTVDAEGATTLAELQSNVSNKEIDGVEYNSDGTYMYTRDLVAAVRDSIVYIETYVNYRGELTAYASGSGIIISSDGYILTNAHVTDDMDAYVISVTTTDPETGTGVSVQYDATLVGSDTDTDIAVLKIDAENLQAAVLGDSDELQLGDDVIAIGNPLGLETSVSKGIVSGLNRQVSSSEYSLSAIQTDAAINSGNSGGALFNMYGEVVGVVNSKLVNSYAENIGFAITINDAKSVINDLISNGYVTGRPILGITCLQITEYVAAIQGMTPGLYVTEIYQDLPIASSGLVVGDTIVAIDGTSVTTTAEVATILNGKKPGDTVTATVVRTDSLGRDKNIDIEIVLAEYSGS